MATVRILLVLAFTAGMVISSHEDKENSDTREDDNHLEMYKSLLSLKRKEQIETVERVWKVEDYAKQYKAIQMVSEAMFPIISESLQKLDQMGYVAGDPFPEDRNTQEVLGKVYENVLFFGDFLLRMPDMTKKIYKQHRVEWQPILEEAVRFCNDSKNVFTGHYEKHLSLMAQEIGLIPEDPDYINPFRAMHKTLSDFNEAKNVRTKLEKKKEKSKKRRGPKLRGGKRRTEL